MFTPAGRANDTCSGILAYEASRPDPPAYLFNWTLGLYVMMASLHVCTLPIMWKWRNKSRFYKIRPFFLTWAFQLTLLLYLTTYLLPGLTNDHVPCWLLIVGTTVPLAFMTSNLGLRIMTLAIETLYMQSVRVHLAKYEQHQSNEETSATESITVSHTMSRWQMTRVFVSILMGYYSPHHFSPKDLLTIKRSNAFISILFSSYGWIICIFLIVLVPPYHSNCNQCDFFNEISIGIFIGLFVSLFFLIRIAYLTLLIVGGWDKKGVLFEMMWMFITSGMTMFVGWILVMTDPGKLSFNKIVYWPWIQVSDNFIAWFFSCFLQLCLQYREDRLRRTKYNESVRIDSRSVGLNSLRDTLMSNNPIKHEFEEYAQQHFVLDSILFLYDVSLYKRYYYEKSDNWKISTCNRIIDRYVRSNSEYEINISYHLRHAILQLKPTENSKPDNLIKIFDDAYRDIEQMVQQGPWRDFILRRQIKKSSVSNSILPLV